MFLPGGHYGKSVQLKSGFPAVELITLLATSIRFLFKNKRYFAHPYPEYGNRNFL
jgi:hypothetical protein